MREGNLPLRTVLQNFINRVNSLEANNEINGDVQETEFQELKTFTEDLKGVSEYSSIEGEKDCNRRKNRYKDILPYDYSRVILQDISGISGSDYVNANYIRGASGSRAYIASQGPLPHTVSEFWRMVVECDVQVIVMASNETEGGKHKCECYWVSVEGEEKQFGNVQVTYIKSRQVCPDFLVRTFKIRYTTDKNKKEERIICQFHYILWPDHGIPDTVRPLLDMVRLVRDCQASETLPVLVHCSAGCGRTGTICAIDYVWGLLRTGKLNQNVDLFGLVKEMRKQRVAMVQTREQYVLLHQAVQELFRERLMLIDAHPYENITTDGNPIIPTEKESDYEELFVCSEKQDKSTKIATMNPSISLAQNQSTSNSKENIRRSASTSSLESSNFIKSNINHAVNNLAPTSSMSQGLYQSMPTESHNGDNNSFKKNNSIAATIACSVIPERKNYSKPSKMEKDAENFAQLAKVKMGHSKKSNIKLSNQIEDAPKPPTRSRTPSPSLIRHANVARIKQQDFGNQMSDVNKRANIHKFKEVFEMSPELGSRPTKLTRSASSISIRPNFSVANTNNLDGGKKFSSSSVSKGFKDRNLLICPPPPPTDPIPEHWKIKRSLTALSLVTSKPCVNSQIRPDMLIRNDERPSLPIKKSKSFRCSEQDKSSYQSLNVQSRKPNPSQPTNFPKSEHEVDTPAVKERLKLSVYQCSDVSSSSSSSTNDIHNNFDNRPIVPPKKTIGDRFKSFKVQLAPVNPHLQSRASNISEDKLRKTEPIIDEKCKLSVGTQMYPNELPLRKQAPKDVTDYVEKIKPNLSNSYVNAKIMKPVGQEDHYYVPLPSKRNCKTRNPYVNYNVAVLDPTIKYELKNTEINVLEGKGIGKMSSRSSEICSVNSADVRPTSNATDYEPVDFGEGVNLSNDTFETINYELVNAKSSSSDDQKDFYLNRDLDTIAKQVYKDCEAYLLSRDNSSPIPSLLPKQSIVEPTTKAIQQPKTSPPELERVINKIAVPPQGLRSRERRNSYRQAVSSTNKAYAKSSGNRLAKNVHKYERIWFENDEDPRSAIFRDSSDFPLDMNKDENTANKDSLFKDKLEEINLMMNDIERKQMQYLPDLSEEELSSKHSGSTSSLISRSGQSSRSSERAEPVYVNTGSGKSPHSIADEQKIAPFLGGRRMDLDSRAFGGSSHYGTLATTTSYPYRPNKGAQYGFKTGPGVASKTNPYTATLPLRSAAIPNDNNMLYTPSIYRKPVIQQSGQNKEPPHNLQVYQSSSKTKSGSSTVKSPPVLHQKEHTVKKRDPLKKMDTPIKPSEVHRKRQQINAKESIYKERNFAHSTGHNSLQQSMSMPYCFPPPPKPSNPNRLTSKNVTDAYAKSDKAEASLVSKMTKKRNSKDLKCITSTALSDSSLDESSADDDGVFVKFAPTNILKKFRTAQASTSKLYKEDSADGAECQSSGEILVSPSSSPKTFTKAFDKFKTGSKNVAANFKSYIKGDKTNDDDSSSKGENGSNSNIQSFEDVQNYKFPQSLPKRPQGLREIPRNFVPNSTSFAKKSKQQYL